MPQRFLRGPDLVHQQNGINPCADLPDGLLCDFGYGCMEQEPPGWRLGRVIALDHPRSFPLFLQQLERGLDQVRVQPRGRVQSRQSGNGRDAFEPPVADQATYDGTVLLLYPGLVILSVRARSGHLKTLAAAPLHDRLVHESAVVVEIYSAQGKGKQRDGFAIASITSVPSRNTTGTHSVHPVAISVNTSVW